MLASAVPVAAPTPDGAITPRLRVLFLNDTARNGGPGRSLHTILISYGSWQRRFGNNSNVIGRQIQLNNITYTIIGVLPREFHFAPIGAAEFWAALNDPSSCDQRRGCHGLFGIAVAEPAVGVWPTVAVLSADAAACDGWI